MKVRFLALCFSFFLSVVFSFPSVARSVTYKWTDAQGKEHFTNNKSSIPRQFLTRDHKDKRKLPEPEKGPGPGAEPEGKGGNAGAEGEGQEALSAEEQEALVKEAKNYLELQNKRFERLTKKKINTKNGRAFIKTLSMGLSDKKRRAEKYGEAGHPALTPVASFLLTSLSEDMKVEPESSHDIAKLKGIQARIQKEQDTRTRLIKALDKALKNTSS